MEVKTEVGWYLYRKGEGRLSRYGMLEKANTGR